MPIKLKPESKKKLGLLEKKKDFKERSRDYRQKQEKLRKIKLQVAFKNPDEYNMKMKKLKRVPGGHIPIDTEEPSKEVVLNIKDQDMKYLLMKKSIESKKINNLQSSLHMLTETVPAERNHIIFVDNEEEVEKFDPVDYFETSQEFLNRSYNRPLKSSLSEKSIIVNSDRVDHSVISEQEQSRAKSYRELIQRMEREEQLKNASNDIYIQKQALRSSKDDYTIKKRRRQQTSLSLEETKTTLIYLQENKSLTNTFGD